MRFVNRPDEDFLISVRNKFPNRYLCSRGRLGLWVSFAMSYINLTDPNSDQIAQRLAVSSRGSLDPLIASRVGLILTQTRVFGDAAPLSPAELPRAEFLAHLKSGALNAPTIAKANPAQASEALVGAFRLRFRLLSGADLPLRRLSRRVGIRHQGARPLSYMRVFGLVLPVAPAARVGRPPAFLAARISPSTREAALSRAPPCENGPDSGLLSKNGTRAHGAATN